MLVRSMHGSMRYIEPVAVTFRVDSLEPNGEPCALCGIGNSVLGDIAPVSDGDVSMHFDLDRVEIPRQVLSVFDSLQKTLLSRMRLLPVRRWPRIPGIDRYRSAIDAKLVLRHAIIIRQFSAGTGPCVSKGTVPARGGSENSGFNLGGWPYNRWRAGGLRHRPLRRNSCED